MRLLAIATDNLAAPVDDVEFGAFKIKVAYPIVLLFGAEALVTSYMYFLGLAIREVYGRDTIIRLYGELGFDDESLHDEEANPT